MINSGIFITWDFFKDKSTTMNEKVLLLEISNLSMLEHGCVASNEHFASKMGIKKEAVSRLISSLQNKGYIHSEMKNGTRNFGRKITLNKMLFDPKQNVISPLTNCEETKGNKTINKTINLETYPNLNFEAFQEWINYKPKDYTKKGQVLSANLLSKYSPDEQVRMVENSIMNGYKGLVEPKQNSQASSKINSFMDMKKYLSEKYLEIKSIPIYYGEKIWKIAKDGVPYDISTVEDMPFEQRKTFWIYMMNNMHLLEIAS